MPFQKKNMNWEIIFIILSAAITAGLAIHASIENSKKDKELKQNQKKLEDAQQQLSKSQAELLKYTTGYGFPYLEISPVKSEGKNDLFAFRVINDFKYPIYNIEIQALDYEKILQSSFEHQGKRDIKIADYLNTVIFEFNKNEIPPNEFRMGSQTYSPKSASLYIRIHSRNGRVIQKFVFVLRGLTLYAGFVVVDGQGHIVKEHYYTADKEIQKQIKEKLDQIPNELELEYLY
jgi:hypothetical protein